MYAHTRARTMCCVRPVAMARCARKSAPEPMDLDLFDEFGNYLGDENIHTAHDDGNQEDAVASSQSMAGVVAHVGGHGGDESASSVYGEGVEVRILRASIVFFSHICTYMSICTNICGLWPLMILLTHCASHGSHWLG